MGILGVGMENICTDAHANKSVALVTNTGTDFGKSLAQIFAREGFCVFAMGNIPMEGITTLPAFCADVETGTRVMASEAIDAVSVLEKKAGKLDFLLDTADFRDPKDGFTILDGINGPVVERSFRLNVMRSMALLEAFLPLLEIGNAKRLLYLTSAEASINETCRIDNYAYCMSKAALHQFIQMSRNKLSPRGYTFRVFDTLAGELAPKAAAESAFNYITRRRGTENHDPLRDDENNLVFRDAFGRQHSW